MILRCTVLSAILFLFSQLAYSQLSGRMQFKELGIEFVIPDGWVGQQSNDGVLLSSTNMSGIVIIMLHEYKTVDELTVAAEEGFQDEEGMYLTVSGAVESYRKNGVEALFSGNVQWQPAKAYAVGLVSPHGGGLVVLAAAGSGEFTSSHKKVVEALAASVVFSKPDLGDAVAQWKQMLTGMKLTYMNSYSSSGGGGGYSDKEVIGLCPDGSFGYYSSSSTVVNANGAGGYTGDQGSGAGQWTVEGTMGEVKLLLRFNDGSEIRYSLRYEDEKTYLNGNRYFRTNDASCY